MIFREADEEEAGALIDRERGFCRSTNTQDSEHLHTMKPLIKKHKVNPKDLVNYRPTSNLPFQSKILEKVVS